MKKFLGIALMVVGASAAAFASQALPVNAPELDGGTALSALALLSGSVLVLRARLKR